MVIGSSSSSLNWLRVEMRTVTLMKHFMYVKHIVANDSIMAYKTTCSVRSVTLYYYMPSQFNDAVEDIITFIVIKRPVQYTMVNWA